MMKYEDKTSSAANYTRIAEQASLLDEMRSGKFRAVSTSRRRQYLSYTTVFHKPVLRTSLLVNG
jgi:hypothetical protein